MNIGDLVVERYKDEIINLVKNNDVSIISADTGTGKSTLIPMYLSTLRKKVIVTQPRSVAAISLASYVSDVLGEEIGIKVGYNTRYEKVISEKNKIIYVTDGIAVINFYKYISTDNILIIDEVHEYNLNIEALLALCKEQQKKGKKFKIVILSATMDVARLSKYFDNAPVLTITGRSYPIRTFWESQKSITQVVIELFNYGSNILVFLPGRKEIMYIKEELQKYFKDKEIRPVIVPLYSELPYEEQEKALKNYVNLKIILATNIAQTSITIPNIDAVVDSGLARRRANSKNKSAETLEIFDISQADSIQRMGRAGRVKPGIYVLCSKKFFSYAEKYEKPKIQLLHLEDMYLRIMALGYNPENLEYYHIPNQELMEKAKICLEGLGAVSEDKLTVLGWKMAEYPLRARFARMILEAEKYSVEEIIVVMVSIMDVGWIRNSEYYMEEYAKETEQSDLFYDLELFKACNSLYEEQERTGIKVNFYELNYMRFLKARRTIVDLFRRYNMKYDKLFMSLDEETIHHIKKCLLTGLYDKIYYAIDDNKLINGNEERSVDKKTTKCVKKGNFIIGYPIDIEINTKNRKTYMVKRITHCTSFMPEEIYEIMPELRKEFKDIIE